VRRRGYCSRSRQQMSRLRVGRSHVRSIEFLSPVIPLSRATRFALALARVLECLSCAELFTNEQTSGRQTRTSKDRELAKERSVLKIIYEIVALPLSWRAAGSSRHIILKVTAGENYFPKSPYEMRRRDRQTLAIPINTTKEKQHSQKHSLHCR